ncbi:MAG: hypothetical protein DRP85_03345 [Candidatus Makaraimicrobium thalassicum]|nr:MAG: hypothetical protein DRP85_03345 [Candidatus Omnitrophota bacterium]
MEKLEKLRVETISSQAASGEVEGPTTRSHSLEQTMKAHERGTTKVCTVCDKEKEQDDYYFIKARGTFMAHCKKCYGDKIKAKHKEDPSKRKAKSKRYRDKHQSEINKRQVKWTKDNAERTKEIIEKCQIEKAGSPAAYRHEAYLKNPASFQKANIKRRRSVIQAMPPWYDEDEVNKLYIACRLVSQVTGVLHHVDHIIPLNGKNVCGFHVHTNMRIITAAENLAKGNKLVDDIVSSTARVVGASD